MTNQIPAERFLCDDATVHAPRTCPDLQKKVKQSRFDQRLMIVSWYSSAVMIMHRYWKNPELTASVWDDEGWYHTGDVGELSYTLEVSTSVSFISCFLRCARSN